jgi:hypothetical protein
MMENQTNEQFMRLQHDLRRYYHRKMAKKEGFGPHRGQGRVLTLLKMNPRDQSKRPYVCFRNETTICRRAATKT